MGFQICELVIADVGLTGPQCLLSEICHSSPSFKSAVGAVIIVCRPLYIIKDCSMEGPAGILQNIGAVEEDPHQVWLCRNCPELDHLCLLQLELYIG